MQTHQIASFNEALELLTKLKDMKTAVRVNLGFPNTMISFEGTIVRANETGLEVISTAGPNAGHFRVEPLDVFQCIGGVSEIENEVHVHLTIVREGQFSNLSVPRTSLNAVFTGVKKPPAS